jgi:hypothetical protein
LTHPCLDHKREQRSSKDNLAATEWSEGIGIKIKVKSASIPDKETFFNTNQQQKLLPCFELGW